MSKRRLAFAASSALVVLVLAHQSSAPAHGQTLTRVTDPTNPITTDLANSGGGSWIDLDDDGDLELFVANGNLVSQPNALYFNLGSGSFKAVTTGPISADGGSSIGGTWGDYDNDGRVDLFVTNRNNFGNFLYHGEGDSLFTKVTATPPVTDIANSNSSSWVDADLDGDLDLYVVNFAATDFLYRNDGAPFPTFTPIIGAAPLGNTTPSIPGAWADYDNDRDQDLFLGIAGTGADVLWRNDGGFVFTRLSFSDSRSTLGASWGDFDNDGDLDLLATCFSNQKSLLYRNGGAPSFTLTLDNTTPITNINANAVGSGWGDYDNDGDLDLFVGVDGANNLLFANDGPPNYTFTQVLTGDPVSDGGSTFGIVWGDYDADGQIDLFAANQLGQANFLYRNEGNANHWLTVRATGTISNRSAIGAKVRVLAVIGGAPRWQMQEVVAQTGYNSQNLDLHFGLGDAATADSIVVEWPAGGEDILVSVPADQLLRLFEGGTTGAPTDAPTQGMSDPFLILEPAVEASSLGIRLALREPGQIEVSLFTIAGRRVDTQSGLAGTGERRVALGSASLASGVYLCQVNWTGAHDAASRSTRIVWVR